MPLTVTFVHIYNPSGGGLRAGAAMHETGPPVGGCRYHPAMAITMIGRGMYDASELGRLLGHDADWVVRWSTPSSHGDAIVKPTFDRVFTFEDLVALQVATVVRSRRVSDTHLRRGVATLRELTGLEQPLASLPIIESLATSGRSFLSDLANEEFEDIGQGRQGVFQNVIRVNLTRVTFDERGDPQRWAPAEGILIDPAIQAGAPCVAGTRVPTTAVADLAADSEPEDVALDFNLSVGAVRSAVEFEQSLADGDRLAA